MQLDKLIIETRIRSAWSSIDLGFSLARLFWVRAFCLYLIMAIPVYCLTLLFDDSVNALLPYFIFWLLKPIFERPLLHMMSRELFSQKMSIRNVLLDVWLWLKPSFFWLITVRRWSFYRSITAPIMLLEQPSGSDYAKRKSVLLSKCSSESFWLTVILYHVESFLFFAFMAVLVLFFPDSIGAIWSNILDDNRDKYFDILYLLIMAAVAPFFVVGGFMMYISRRIELEGWDIEITFRNWLASKKPKTGHNQSLSSGSSVGGR